MTKREGNRLKKPVLILLAIAVAFVLFSGCGEAGNEVPPETTAPSTPAAQDAGVQADGPEQMEPAQPAEPDNPAPEDSGPRARRFARRRAEHLFRRCVPGGL